MDGWVAGRVNVECTLDDVLPSEDAWISSMTLMPFSSSSTQAGSLAFCFFVQSVDSWMDGRMFGLLEE